MIPRQLNIFKGKRQKGELPPPPTEFKLTCAIARSLQLGIHPRWKYTHLPFGEKRDPATAARLQAMGVTPGWPDFMFVGPGRVVFLELKRPGQAPRLSADQIEVGAHLQACGCDYLVANSYEAAIDMLIDLGIVRVSVSV